MFRVGIIGAGHIARKMAATVSAMDGFQNYAVASRSLSKAEDFASEFSFCKAYGSYEELADDPAVDMIYVATPHSFHYSHVKMCLEKGKPVLCEKAFMLNAREAAEVIRISRERNVFLGEAIWTRYMPSRKMISDIIASGKIGVPTALKASLSYPVEYKERVSRADLGGGALLDLGVYCLNFAAMVFGTDIKTISSTCIRNDDGVDIQETYSLLYNDGKVAALMSSVLCSDDRQGVICGDKGYMIIENINNPSRIDVYGKDHVLIESVSVPDQMTGFEYQVAECADAIGKGYIEPASMPHSEIMRIMELMDTLRGEWGVRFPGEAL